MGIVVLIWIVIIFTWALLHRRWIKNHIKYFKAKGVYPIPDYHATFGDLFLRGWFSAFFGFFSTWVLYGWSWLPDKAIWEWMIFMAIALDIFWIFFNPFLNYLMDKDITHLNCSKWWDGLLKCNFYHQLIAKFVILVGCIIAIILI